MEHQKLQGSARGQGAPIDQSLVQISAIVFE